MSVWEVTLIANGFILFRPSSLRDPKAEKFGAPVCTCIDRDKYLKLDASCRLCLAVMRSDLLDVESLNAQALKLKLKL